ncbi:MAG: FmdB family zinc ribbon protein [Planctomycetota bacterium]|jgi:putative FmdB family regulatory protein
MPIYEYKCTKCRTKFEVFVHTSRAKVKCEKCGSGRIKKQFSVFGLKGGDACSSCSVKPSSAG